MKYLSIVAKLLYEFDDMVVQHIPHMLNWKANKFGQIVSKYRIIDQLLLDYVMLNKSLHLSKIEKYC